MPDRSLRREGNAAYDHDVRDLDIGWRTDVEVLALSGSQIDDRGDYLVIRTPTNPTYNWGNCILVTDLAAADDATRWVQTFAATFPTATWLAIGLPRMPADRDAWAAYDVLLEVDEVLAAASAPRQIPLPHGYSVRRLTGDDWDQHIALTTSENELTRSWEADAYAAFARARTEAMRTISDSDHGAYFGAFVDHRLVASLGIVRCGRIARYQNVLTDANHRGRGLASHLLGEAAHWAAAHNCERWVIVTEAENPAKRIYRHAGLRLHSTNVQAYRRRLSPQGA